MAKSAKGAAAAKLVENATAAPGVFVFAELLEHPNVQEVSFDTLIVIRAGELSGDCVRFMLAREQPSTRAIP